MATFKAFALLTDFLGADRLPGGAEHTYVVCGDKRWGCAGRSRGGRQIASGSGSKKKGKCLGNGNSGIRPPVNGVCHQAANRILWAAGKTVSRARGYAASVSLFGAHGLDAPVWVARKQYCELQNIIPGDFPRLPGGPGPTVPIRPPRFPPFPSPWSMSPPREELVEFLAVEDVDDSEDADVVTTNEDAEESESEIQYASQIIQLYRDSDLSESQRMARDLALLIEFRLGQPIGESTLNALMNTRSNARNDMSRISVAHDTGEVSPEACSKHARAVGNETMVQFARTLGDNSFERIFEMTATDAAEVVSMTPYASIIDYDEQ